MMGFKQSKQKRKKKRQGFKLICNVGPSFLRENLTNKYIQNNSNRLRFFFFT